MTTEDALQAALDANPDDHGIRLILADFLDEQGDPRGPGMRTTGTLETSPHRDQMSLGARSKNGTGPDGYISCWWNRDLLSARSDSEVWFHSLPADWLMLLEGAVDYQAVFAGQEQLLSKDYRTRLEAEDAAALAFAKLPPARQAELLPQPVGASA